MTDALSAIAAERERQRGLYDHANDDAHAAGELAIAAALYAAPIPLVSIDDTVPARLAWRDPHPWADYDARDKGHSRLRLLEIAGALIVAEIERLHRKRQREREAAERLARAG